MNPTDPKTPEPAADLHGLVGDRITAGEPISKPEVWECTPRLRWYNRISACGTGTIRILQQLWSCRQTGAIEWRDVEVSND